MHQTYNGNQWYFGMKAHIDADSRSKLIHSVEATAANAYDSRLLEKLLHGKERRVWGNSGYSDQKEAMAKAATEARDWTQEKGHRYRKLTERDRARNATSPGFEPSAARRRGHAVGISGGERDSCGGWGRWIPTI